MNTFLEHYKLFNNQFTFKKMPLKDYLQIMSDRNKKALDQIEDLRKKNPKKAAEEDTRARLEHIKKQENYIQKRVQLAVADKHHQGVVGPDEPI